jgi:N-acetyl-anhydromuramyl-L-alanine amidase AmpD
MIKNLSMKKTHLLGVNNYYQTKYDKTQIVIGNTQSTGMNHVVKWKTRLNGNYKITAPFTISKDGTIYVHYDPKHHSDFIGIREIDRQIIPIVLENEGWLVKDLENGCFLNWVGDIYKGNDDIVETRWRNHTYWAPYSNEQVDSLVKLCKYLCDKFNISLEAIPHNTKADIENFSGIVYRSNYSKYFTDVSPAFDTMQFKNKLELK